MTTYPLVEILLTPLWERTQQAICKVLGHRWMVRLPLPNRDIIVCTRCCKRAVLHHEIKALIDWDEQCYLLERNVGTKLNWLEG